MKRMVLSLDVISAFITQQRQDEKSKATLEKYNRDILAFYSFLPEDKRVDKEKVIDYKTHLIEADYAVLAPGDRDHILSGVFNQFLSANPRASRINKKSANNPALID